MILDSSKFRHWLTLQSYTETKSDLGQSLQDWGTVAEFWGSIEQLSGKEAVFVTQVYASATHKVCCRDPGFLIDPTMRFQYIDNYGNSHFYNILNAENVLQRGRFYDITVTEVFEGQ